MSLPNEGEIRGYTELRRNSIGVFRLLWQAMGTMSIAADAAYLLTGGSSFRLGGHTIINIAGDSILPIHNEHRIPVFKICIFLRKLLQFYREQPRG